MKETPTIIFRGGQVIDGSGAAAIAADVAINGDRILAVGDIGVSSGAEIVDIGGHVIAPGFIDVHTHDDRLLLSAPDMAPKASQGVTTVVTGNCGISLAPLKLRIAAAAWICSAISLVQFSPSPPMSALDREPPAVRRLPRRPFDIAGRRDGAAGPSSDPGRDQGDAGSIAGGTGRGRRRIFHRSGL
jgi:hypothetical protein